MKKLIIRLAAAAMLTASVAFAAPSLSHAVPMHEPNGGKTVHSPIHEPN